MARHAAAARAGVAEIFSSRWRRSRWQT